jgi:integrase
LSLNSWTFLVFGSRGKIKMALTVKRVLRLKQRGKYPDGLGLYLQVNGNNRSWIFRYKQSGKQHWMGLGPVTAFSLEEARELARKARQQLKQGNDPLLARQQAEKKLVVKTFKQCASGYLVAHGSKWKTAKGLDDFTASLERYVYPTCGDVPVALIDTAMVMRCIEPIWRSKTPTASRLRGRMEDILHWATVQGFRTGANPAQWDKHLEHLLPAVSQIKKNNHHAALAYGAMPEFMTQLRAMEGLAARALELTVLCATRTNETLGAKWDEVNLDEKVWTVPAARMKGGHAHRLPLSDRAVEILQHLPRMNEYIFPALTNDSNWSHLSRKGMVRLLQRMGYENQQATVHGFRSTFRDWAAETTATPNHVVEMALAHRIGDKVEAAYRRGDLFIKRTRLMADWAGYCQRPPTAVLPLRQSA